MKRYRLNARGKIQLTAIALTAFLLAMAYTMLYVLGEII